MVFGWRAGVHRQGYALVCAKKVLDILVVVIDGMTICFFISFLKWTVLNLAAKKRESKLVWLVEQGVEL